FLARPAVDGQTERRLADERMTADRRERRAGRIERRLVIARDHPDFPVALQANLRRAEDVPGRMERDLDAPDLECLAVGDAADIGIRPKARPQHAKSRASREVMRAARAGVIAVAVSDEGARRRQPGIDEEIAGRAVEALGSQPQKRFGHTILYRPPADASARTRAPHVPCKGASARSFALSASSVPAYNVVLIFDFREVRRMLAWLAGPLNIILILVGLFLILLILIQRGKGGGLIGALGGSGGSSPFGSRAGDQFTRLTIYVAIGWLLLTMIQVKAIQYDYQTTARTSAFGRQEQ